MKSQFAALEPSWATRYKGLELRGLLVLASLFNEQLYIHDTQLADNPLLLSSYELRGVNTRNIYCLLEDLIKNNIIKVLIRDKITVDGKGNQRSVGDLRELHKVLSYRESSSISGGIRGWSKPQQFEIRSEMLSGLHHLMDNRQIIVYPYEILKLDFMQQVRHSLVAGDTTHSEAYWTLPDELRKSYDDLLSRDWFTYGDIIRILNQHGISQDHLFVQAHGLIDELCYSSWNRSRIVGSNFSDWQLERDIARLNGSDIADQMPIAHLDTAAIECDTSLPHILQERALAVVHAPGLSLIGLLDGTEIAELRKHAKELFEFWSLFQQQPAIFDSIGKQMQYVQICVDYWDYICEYIRRTRPHVSMTSTTVGIFTHNQLPTLSKLSSNIASFVIHASLDIAGAVLPGAQISDETRKRITDSLTFRFLFWTEDPAFEQLRTMLPKDTWNQVFRSKT